MFPFTTKTVRQVECQDLDTAITDFLKSKGIDTGEYGYESVSENEWNNDSYYTFEVEAELLGEWDQKQLTAGRIPATETILNWMCADGLIPPGEYLVKVSW